MTKNGITYHAKFVNEAGYIGVYAGNENGFPCYKMPGGEKYCFDANDRFEQVPENEWIAEFDR